jgi:hypothetical protein
MSKSFWIKIRLLGWIILLIWYIIYTINALIPILTNQLVALSHGITGTAGTTLVLIGYYDLITKRVKQKT